MKIIDRQGWLILDPSERDYWTERIESHELTLERVQCLEIDEGNDRVTAIVICRDLNGHLIYNPLDEDVLTRRVPLGSIGDGAFLLAATS